MVQIDRIWEFVQRLSPLTRSYLLSELERLELCGVDVPGSTDIQAKLRAEFRKDGSTQGRAPSTSRYFFEPLDPLLADGEHENAGRIARGSLAPIWEWITRDLLPTMARDFNGKMRDLITADKQKECKQAAAAFQIKVFKSLENTLRSPDTAEQARAKLAAYTAARSTFADVEKIMRALRARDALPVASLIEWYLQQCPGIDITPTLLASLKAAFKSEDHDNPTIGVGEFRSDPRRQPIAHGAEAARGQQRARLLEREHLCDPHLMLPHVSCDDAIALGDPMQLFEYVQKRYVLAVALLVERLVDSPIEDLLVPLGPRTTPLRDALAAFGDLQHIDEHRSNVAYDRHIDTDVFGDRRGINIDVNDLLGVGCEVRNSAGYAIVEARAHRDQAVGVGDGGVGGV